MRITLVRNIAPAVQAAAVVAVDDRPAFEPFVVEVQTRKEAANLAVALRNHMRVMGHGINAPSLRNIALTLNSFNGFDIHPDTVPTDEREPTTINEAIRSAA